MWDDSPELDQLDRYACDNERVLVAVVPRRRDWEQVCAEHWYRIPLARAPRRVAAEYLAFYHPLVFAELRWTITYYAPIKRYSIVRRRALLPSEPHHPRADDLYYKIEIGPLEALPHPVPSRSLRRVTFIMTTMSRLLRAREVNDLWLRQTPGDRLRRAFRVRESSSASIGPIPNPQTMPGIGPWTSFPTTSTPLQAIRPPA